MKTKSTFLRTRTCLLKDFSFLYNADFGMSVNPKQLIPVMKKHIMAFAV